MLCFEGFFSLLCVMSLRADVPNMSVLEATSTYCSSVHFARGSHSQEKCLKGKVKRKCQRFLPIKIAFFLTTVAKCLLIEYYLIVRDFSVLL